MRTLLVAGIFAMVALFQTGCATIIKGDQQPLTVNSNVDGASVFLNGQKIGETPLITKVSRQKEGTTLEVRKDGYKTKRVLLDTKVESVFWVNILSGGVFGSTTDYASQDMFKYAPSTLNIDLVPVKK